MKRATGDFETRSELDIRKVNSTLYAQHPSTKPLCFCYHLPGMKKAARWLPGDPKPKKLFKWIKKGKPFEAHNAIFEWCIWNYVMVPRYGWPPLAIGQMLCSAAKCRAVGLPGGLEAAGKALGLDVIKDEEGKRLINLLCMPQKKTIANRRKWCTDKKELKKLYKYCEQDVMAEIELSDALPDLQPEELATFRLDMKINLTGIYVDKDGVTAALGVLEKYRVYANRRIRQLTRYKVHKGTQGARIVAWAQSIGYSIPNMQAETIKEVLKDKKLPKKLREVLELQQAVSKTSTGKYIRMNTFAANDGRINESLLYYKAHCVTGDTEVLTPKGWQRLDRWRGGIIAQYDIDTKGIEFLNAKRFVGPKVKEWVSVASNYLDIDMTMGHTVPLVSGPTKAAELLKPKDRHYHLCSGFLKAKGLPLSNINMQFVAMMQADGNITNGGKAIRFKFFKQRKVNRCRSILKACGIRNTNTVQSDGAECFYIRQADCEGWMFKAKNFGSWLLSLSYEQRCTLIEELKHWDGKENNFYSSYEKSNVEWVQILCHLSGRRTGRIENDGVHILNRSQEYFTIKNKNISTTTKSQKTYCTETKTGFWVARRNGKVFITGNTGRWGGKDLQPQNLPRPTMKIDPDQVVSDVINLSEKKLSKKYGNPFLACVNACRPMLTAAPGKLLCAADFSAIEACGVMWLAGEKEGMKLLRSGDIYTEIAAEIFNKDYKKLYAAYKAGDHEAGELRFIGKAVILGLGYQMGWETFRNDLADKGVTISEEFAKKVVKLYREKYKKIKQLWEGLNAAAVECVATGAKTTYGKISFSMYRHWLRAKLPSGRYIYYPHARLGRGKFNNACVEYHSYEGGRYFVDSTYGGKLTENLVQGIARDILRDAMLRLDRAFYDIVLTIHDEVITEIEPKKPIKTQGKIEDILTICPDWAHKMPLNVEGWTGKRYRKG